MFFVFAMYKQLIAYTNKSAKYVCCSNKKTPPDLLKRKVRGCQRVRKYQVPAK